MKSPKLTPIDIKLLKKGGYKKILPEIYELKKTTENNSWHKSQNLFDHTIKVVANLDRILKPNSLLKLTSKSAIQGLKETTGKYNRRDLLMISAVLHDIGKPITLINNSDNTTRCPAHETIGASLIPRFSKRLSLTDRDEKYIKKLVEYHSLFIDIQNQVLIKGKKQYHFGLYKNIVDEEDLELLLLHLADLLASDLDKTNQPEFEKRKQLTLDYINNI